MMKSAVVVLPGLNRERDMARALKLVGGREPAMVWHADTTLPASTDLVVIPGGFSYGDYLRCGAIAARAPIMAAVRAHAARGGLVLGVCNGFQILCEAGLLPGVLMRNAALKFICRDVYLRVERSDTPFTRGYNAGQVIRVPVAHGEGNYVADHDTIVRLEDEGRVVRPRLERQWRDQRHRRRPQRARQRARHDAAPGEPRGAGARSDRRPRPVRGSRRSLQAGGMTPRAQVSAAHSVHSLPRLHRTRVYPSSATLNRPKSDISDFGWRDREGACNKMEGGVQNVSCAQAHPLPNPPPQAGEGADRVRRSLISNRHEQALATVKLL